jgi:sigma-B regulation protein RsbU (phosphoserine phosphatase)
MTATTTILADSPDFPWSRRTEALLDEQLRTAGEVQRKLLPELLGPSSHLDIGAACESSGEVGGDYFDVVEVDETRIAFTIADASGKGLGAALLTAVLQGGMAGLVHTADPARVVGRLNRYLTARSHAHRYVTAILGQIDTNGRIDAVNAGHHAVLLERSGSVTPVFESVGFPIGLFPNAEYESSSLDLEPGDTLLLTSDGVTEARNPGGEEFGMARVALALAAGRHLPAQLLAESLVDAVRAFSGQAHHDDDVTVLVVRYRGGRPAGVESAPMGPEDPVLTPHIDVDR